MKKVFALSILANSGLVIAAGGEGHGSPADLISSFVNLGLLLGFLGWKLKGPATQHFSKKATDISDMVERANIKAKEAEMMMADQQKKMANIESEIAAIQNATKAELEKFEKNYSRETTEKIDKLKVEAVNKIEAEKKLYINELNSEFLDQVISTTKTTVKSDKSLNSQVTDALIKELN